MQRSGTTSADTWAALISLVRANIAEAIEKTLERTHTMHSYDSVEMNTRRELVTRSYQAVLDGMSERRRPDADEDGAFFDRAGETRAQQGIVIREMHALWRIGLENFYGLARSLAPAGPGCDALLLEFLELAVSWGDFAMVRSAEGHRRGELSQARELQHAQTNCVRRVLSGTASPAEIHAAVESLGLDPRGKYHAVRARPMPDFDMDALERYFGADGLVRRGNGLLALIDGDACGFVARLPDAQPPIAVGVSAPVTLTAMQSAFRQAGRALEAALALGFKSLFGLGDLGLHAAVVLDTEVGAVMLDRYIRPVRSLAGGEAILTTVERYLVNDRNVDVTARELAVHPNTVRQRLARLEEATGRPLRDTETLAELWWALQYRQL